MLSQFSYVYRPKLQERRSMYDRLDVLLEIKRLSGCSLDYLEEATRAWSIQALKSWADSLSASPQSMKSSGTP